MSNGFFKSFDDTRIFYSIEGTGPVLCFCYGIVCSELHWGYQMDYFKSKNYTILWFDYRGHHRSDTSFLESMTLENIAKDIGFLFEELQIHKATLLGHSMGVNVALEFYKQYPKRIEKLVLANGGARAPLETLFQNNISQYFLPWLEKMYEKHPWISNFLWSMQGRTKFIPWIVGQLGFNSHLVKQEEIQKYVKLFSKIDMKVFLKLLKEYENYDATSWLHQIHVPTLILSGEKDKIIPREVQEMMHQLIPKSRYKVIRNGSHCPQMDLPELVNVVIDRFFLEESALHQPKALAKENVYSQEM